MTESVPTTHLNEEVNFFLGSQQQINTAKKLRTKAIELRETANVLEEQALVIEAALQKFSTAVQG